MHTAVAAQRDGGVTVAVERAVRAVPEPGAKGNPLLDIATVARRLGVSRKTVRRLIYDRGAFPNWTRVESRVRVPEQDVIAYLRRLSTPVHS